MYFTSFAFVVFLLLVLAAYYTVLRRWQWQLLLVASFVFYAFSGWQNLIYISATILSTWYTGRRMDALLAGQQQYLAANPALPAAEAKAYRAGIKKRRRRWMLACLVLNLGILAVVKYADFALSNVNSLLQWINPELGLGALGLLLPMGISFYTFQSMGYLIDTYRGKKPGLAEASLPRFALFVSFFPQLVQGPISRYGDLKQTLYASRRSPDAELFNTGVTRVLWGFFKKLVIADRLLVAVKALVGAPQEYQGVYVLLAMLLYAITLYADFSGGIDITIGVANLLGIRLAENFDRPFYSKNIAEYWRRWHITMGSWFRDYVFYPLSVSKAMLRLQKFTRRTLGDGFGRRLPVYISTMILWFLTGLWHGASWNFIAWGLANGIVIVLSQECTPLYTRFHARFAVADKRWYRAFAVLRTFVLMCFIRTFDIYPGVGTTLRMFGSVFTNFGLGRLLGQGLAPLGLGLAQYAVAGVAVAVWIAAGLVGQRRGRDVLSKSPLRFPVWFALFFSVLIFGMYGIGYDANQFIYNQF